MPETIKRYWKELDRAMVVNRRELVMGLSICSLTGVLLGMLLSPRKTVIIGSHNGGTVHNTGGGLPPQEPATPGEAEAAAE